MYIIRISVLDIQTWLRGDIPSLVLTDEDVGLLSGVDCDILIQSLIRVIEYSYQQGISLFSEVFPDVHE
jgi:hypothetical protein